MKAENYKLTSDLHFGHKNIMKFCPNTRPFFNTEVMDEALLEAIHAALKPGDTLINCGDFFFHHNPVKIADIVARFPTNKMIWILGNHDYEKHIKVVKDNYPGELVIKDYMELVVPDYPRHKFVISHYPMLQWNKCHHGSMMLHGHCHGGINKQNVGVRRMDVGWDSIGGIIGLNEVYDTLKIEPFAEHHGD